MATASNQGAGLGLEAIYAAKLVESVVGIAWAADPAGNFTYVTATAPTFRGLTLEQLNSPVADESGWKLLTHPDDYSAVFVAWRHALKTGARFEIALRLPGATGAHLWMRASGQALRDRDGRITGWYGGVMDRAGEAADLAGLAASIAHEVNQPLAAVVANAHACHRWLMAQPPRLDRAQLTVVSILRDANAAADVVSRKRQLFTVPLVTGAFS